MSSDSSPRSTRSAARVTERIGPILLAALQRQLESIYEIEVEQRVDDFLITDPDLRDRCDPGAPARDEKLLVCEQGDELYLSLYLDAGLVARIERAGPGRLLSHGNLDDACAALEGVSHFLYLAWNARHARSVTLLELELQAEVDKYVAIARSLASQGHARIPRALHRNLFERVQFEHDLEPEELERYQRANYFAGKYSRSLARRHRHLALSNGMLSDLRRFYRLGQHAKISQINLARA